MPEPADVVVEARKALRGVPEGAWVHIGGGHVDGESGVPVAKVWGLNKASFIAWCRTGVPALLDRIEELQAALPDGEDLWEAQQCVQDWAASDTCDDDGANQKRLKQLAKRLRDNSNRITLLHTRSGLDEFHPSTSTNPDLPPENRS